MIEVLKNFICELCGSYVAGEKPGFTITFIDTFSFAIFQTKYF